MKYFSPKKFMNFYITSYKLAVSINITQTTQTVT